MIEKVTAQQPKSIEKISNPVYYFSKRNAAIVLHMLDLSMHQNEAFQTIMDSCEAQYGEKFEEMLPKVSYTLAVKIMQGILSNNVEDQLPMTEVIV